MGGDGKRLRILVAIEPRVYREAIAAAIRELRPHDVEGVLVVEPGDLAAEAARLGPEAVVIGLLDEPVAAGGTAAPLAWVRYRPYEEPAARVRVGPRRWELGEVSLEDLLRVVDEARRIARPGGEG